MDSNVYIGVGSNLGDRAENCFKAIEAIDRFDGCHVEQCSPLYETEPIGYDDQGWFINAAVRIGTSLDPESLFPHLKSIEKALGRRPSGIHFGPRIVDLDILLFEDLVIRADNLTIPHPGLHKRRFVLRPLADIAPDVLHPVLNETIFELLTNLKDNEKGVIHYSCD